MNGFNDGDKKCEELQVELRRDSRRLKLLLDLALDAVSNREVRGLVNAIMMRIKSALEIIKNKILFCIELFNSHLRLIEDIYNYTPILYDIAINKKYEDNV